jgi:hypothetical protein
MAGRISEIEPNKQSAGVAAIGISGTSSFRLKPC